MNLYVLLNTSSVNEIVFGYRDWISLNIANLYSPTSNQKLFHSSDIPPLSSKIFNSLLVCPLSPLSPSRNSHSFINLNQIRIGKFSEIISRLFIGCIKCSWFFSFQVYVTTRTWKNDSSRTLEYERTCAHQSTRLIGRGEGLCKTWKRLLLTYLSFWGRNIFVVLFFFKVELFHELMSIFLFTSIYFKFSFSIIITLLFVYSSNFYTTFIYTKIVKILLNYCTDVS